METLNNLKARLAALEAERKALADAIEQDDAQENNADPLKDYRVSSAELALFKWEKANSYALETLKREIEEADSDTARGQARAQVRSIVAMVAALECDYDQLNELREERADSSFPSRVLAQRKSGNPADHSDGWWEDVYPTEAEELADLEEAAGDCEDSEEAKKRIQEDPLSIEVRGGWYSPGEAHDSIGQPEDFRIVLCAGGPHVEILGDLDAHNQPSRAYVQYASWGESGTYHLDAEERAAVLTYCQQFSFGE